MAMLLKSAHSSVNDLHLVQRGLHASLVVRVCTPFLLVLFSLPATASSPDREDFAETLNSICNEHATSINSGRCSGRLVQRFQRFDEDQPKVRVDCDFDIVFSGEKFRIERQFRRNQALSNQRGFWDTSKYVRQVFLFRGKESYWARFDAEGNASCLVLNRNWARVLLQHSDSPGIHPIRLWESARATVQNANLDFEVGPLRNTGLLARASGLNYTVNCYLLPPEPLRLSRLEVKVAGAVVREFNFDWAEANGLAYVNRYAETSITRSGVNRSSQSRLIEFTDMHPNVEVETSEFELTSLGVPEGTIFRATAPVPARFVFDGQQLVRMTSD